MASLALGQSGDCPSASEATLKDMGKINPYQITTKHNGVPTMPVFLGIYSKLHPIEYKHDLVLLCIVLFGYINIAWWIDMVCLPIHIPLGIFQLRFLTKFKFATPRLAFPVNMLFTSRGAFLTYIFSMVKYFFCSYQNYYKIEFVFLQSKQ